MRARPRREAGRPRRDVGCYPLEPQPHDADVRALLRIAVVYNVPLACNRATADFVLSSPLLREPYERLVGEHAAHLPSAAPSEG